MTEAERLAQLNGRHFSAPHVMRAAELSTHTHGNYIAKSPLELCSAPSGQGRARRYCLIDVYQLALLDVLAKITGKVALSAEALNYNLFVDAEIQAIFAERKKDADPRVDYDAFLNAEKDKFCDSIYSTPECYYHRDLKNCIFLVFEHWDITQERPVLEFGRRDSLLLTMSEYFKGGIVWNMTAHLARIDARLDAIVSQDRPRT